jgi:DNA repair protein RadD
MQPRDYQSQLMDDARLKLRDIAASLEAKGVKRKPRLMIQSGCGSGKTALSGFITANAIAKGRRVGFLVHRNFLIEQTSKTYAAMGIRHSYLAAGKPLNPRSKVHLGMIGSMKARMDKIQAPDICFIDEAHRAVASTYRKVIEAWPNTTFIYLSATPGSRMDGVGLNEVSDDIVCGPSNAELIAMGALSGYRWLEGRPIGELDALKKIAGEYSAGQQEAILDKPAIFGDVVGTYRKQAMGKRAVYFAPTVKMSEDLAAAFCSAGIPFAHMDAATPDWKRKAIARDIASGKLFGFCNVAIATEGFDLSAQAGVDVTIEVAGLVRRTASLPLLIQMSMRAMRAKPTPGIILDHCANHSLHGGFLPDDDITWSLSGAERKPKLTPDVRCPGCHAMLSASVHVCPHCGCSADDEREMIARKRAEMEVIEGELLEVRRAQEQEAAALEAAQKLAKKREEWQCKTLEDWRALAARRGLKPGWAWYRYNNQKRRA